jgi:hypothetical protein
MCSVDHESHASLQWLALDKEAKKLSVETTANQVKDVFHICLFFL